MRTMLLDLDNWDLRLDSAGQIALTTGAYAIAQNVANAIRLFTNDAYFDPDKGIPHFSIDLGQKPNLAVIRSRLRKAALSVEGVKDVDVQITGIKRVKNAENGMEWNELQGDIKLSLTDGGTASVTI